MILLPEALALNLIAVYVDQTLGAVLFSPNNPPFPEYQPQQWETLTKLEQFRATQSWENPLWRAMHSDEYIKMLEDALRRAHGTQAEESTPQKDG